MTVTDIMRDDVATFLLTATSPADVYSLISEGITEANEELNPEVTTETYIGNSNASTTVERYAPTIPIQGKCKKGDAVFDYIDDKRIARAVGSAAESYILQVRYYETAVSGDQYPAQKIKVAIAINSWGGPGGQVNQINFTLHESGDPVAGLYDVSAGTFTPS